MNKYKVLLPMLLNIILSGLTGLMLSIPYLKIWWLLLYSSLFEVSIYWLINKSLKTDRTSLQISKRFKSFLNQTKWFQLLLIA